MTRTPLPEVPYGSIDRAYEDRFASTPVEDEGPIFMVNLMAYKPRAEYPDGRETELTGKQADDLYAPFGPFGAVGAELVYVADVDTQLLGHAPQWDRVAVVRYPSRDAFLQMVELPEYEALHVHKLAGMASTIIMAGTPIDAPAVPDDAPPLDEVPFPSTPEDGPVTVLHVLKYNEGEAYADMVAYQSAAGLRALPHGVRISAWFDIEGTLIGDGRQWDQARFNWFPSRAAFMAVALDPERLSAQHEHREPAIADTYTMILRPILDRLSASVAG